MKLSKFLSENYTPAQILTQCGELLYGDRWQSALAADLEVTDRTMRRWVAATSAIPDDVMGEVVQLMRERTGSLERMIEALEELGHG